MARILVVDDNEDACRMLAALAAKSGHEGVCATSGDEALARARDGRLDLVILDAMMPGMDGMEVLRRLREDPRTASVPVVIWSAISDANYIKHAKSRGATEYWVKTHFDYKELAARIEQLLPRR